MSSRESIRHDCHDSLQAPSRPPSGASPHRSGRAVLVALIATPVPSPPELTSISAARKSVDFSALPRSSASRPRRHRASFRHYPASGPAVERAAIVVHGSSGLQRHHHPRAVVGAAARGVETFAVDIRGQADSGTAATFLCRPVEMILPISSRWFARPRRRRR